MALGLLAFLYGEKLLQSKMLIENVFSFVKIWKGGENIAQPTL